MCCHDLACLRRSVSAARWKLWELSEERPRQAQCAEHGKRRGRALSGTVDEQAIIKKVTVSRRYNTLMEENWATRNDEAAGSSDQNNRHGRTSLGGRASLHSTLHFTDCCVASSLSSLRPRSMSSHRVSLGHATLWTVPMAERPKIQGRRLDRPVHPAGPLLLGDLRAWHDR